MQPRPRVAESRTNRRGGSAPPDQLAGSLRLALRRDEAAASLGMSLDSFERHVQPDLRLVRRGKLRLVPVSELQRWLDENASLVLDPRRPAA